MKRFFNLLLLLVALISLPQSSLAYDYMYNGFYYNLDPTAGTAVLTYANTSYNSYSGVVEVPEFIVNSKGVSYDVIEIGDNAFRSCTGLTSVTLPATIEKIGANAFYGCSGITTIKIPSMVEEIGASAFRGCTKLTTATLPTRTYTSISNELFYGCSALKEITIPTKVTSIGNYAFYGCSKLVTASIPTSVTSIGDYAFTNCTMLKECKAQSVKTIGSNAFQGCTSLANVSIPSVESISSYVFDNCKAMTSLTLSPALTVIGDYSFRYCSLLTDVALRDPLATIGNGAFQYCSGLKSIVIPKSVNSIGTDAFSGCSNLLDLAYEQGTQTALRTYATYIERVTIPEGVVSIAEYAFCNSSGLSEVTLPKTVTSIGQYAFDGCSNLKYLTYAPGTTTILRTYATSLVSVSLPESATTISDNAFYNCSRLNNVTLPGALTSIGMNAFAGCSALSDLTYGAGTRIALKTYATALTTVTIPSSVKEFADGAFSSCNNLSRVNISSLEMWNYIFLHVKQNPFVGAHTLYLDGKQLTELIADFGRPVANFAFNKVKDLRSVTLGHSVTGVDAYAFQNCPDLETLVIGNHCAYISQSAFTNCTSLQTVKLGSGMKEIGNDAFSGCTELNSFKMGGNEEKIGNNAFKSCAKLPRLDLSATLTSIGSSAFYDCHTLDAVTVPAGVSVINDYTFYNCHNLQSAVMPAGIASVGQYAFYDCNRLKEITFGDVLSEIKSNAFNNCDSLKYAHLGTGIKTLGSACFANCNLFVGMYCGAIDVPTTNYDVFNGSNIREAYLYIPDESKDKYAAASPWSEFSQKNQLSDAPTYVTKITLSPTVLVLEEGDLDQITATVAPANATNQKLTWRSSKNTVAYVTSKGKISAEEEGVATITCTSADGHGTTAKAIVIVANNYVPLASLTLDKANVNLVEGEEEDVTPTLAPANATYPEVLWTSSDNNIAVVSEIGRITALRKGDCVVTCSTNDGSGIVKQVKVKVTEPVYATLATVGDLDADGQILKSDVDEMIQLFLGNKDGVDTNMADVNHDGSVNMADVVILVDAIMTGKGMPAGKLMLAELPSDNYEMLTRETLALNPILVPYRAASHLNWSSSDRDVVTVDAMGNLTAINPGRATVKAEATDGSGLTMECTVNVKENPYGTTDGHTWVDLGLPSGTRWATQNVGATAAEQAGKYLAWGETAEKKDYSWSTYTYSDGTATTLNKYCVAASYGNRDNKSVLEANDNAASKLWSSNWGMPSQAQWAELVDQAHTTTEWTTQNGVAGLKVTSKVNGHSLFLPAAGYYKETGVASNATGGYYASNQLGTVSSKDYIFNFGDGIVNAEDEAFRCYGMSIRPVLTTSISMSASDLQLDVNQKFTLTASASSSTAKLRWRSSDTSIATVDQNGVVTALAYGSATIYAVLADATEITAHCDLTVEQPVVTLSETYTSFGAIGEAGKLEAIITHNSGTLPVKWTTSDANVVAVANDGTITAMGEGLATITATVNGVSASCEVLSVRYNNEIYAEDWISSNHTGGSVTEKEYVFMGNYVSFQWQVSSRSGYDYLTVTIDGTQVLRQSGNSYSGTYTKELPAGRHKMVVSYSKSYSGTNYGTDTGKVYNVKFTANMIGYSRHNGYEYVDLGLSVKWATCNVGASTPEDNGYYFAWGATTPQSNYNWVNCPYQTQNTTSFSSARFTKYLGSTTSSYKNSSATDEDALKTVLDPEDDAAHVNWGGNWRMPTKAEQDELRSNCTWTWNSTKKGYLVTSNKNGNSIFLPAAGYRSGSGLSDAGSRGNYWSSSLGESNPYCAYYLRFDSGYVGCRSFDRLHGQSVRAVCQ